MTPVSTAEIAIPVLNEAPSLAGNVQTVHAFLRTLPAPWCSAGIVVADNGSTDDTEEIGRSLEAAGIVRYVRLRQRGVGIALKAAWGSSAADIIGYMDLDLATDLQHLHEVFAQFSTGAHVVCGTRLHAASVVRGRKLRREVTSRTFNRILQTYLGATFSDGMCGFKFLRRSILPELLANGAESDGWFFATEVLFVAQRLGFDLREIPVAWTDSPDSRVKISKLTVEYLAAMRSLKARTQHLAAR